MAALPETMIALKSTIREDKTVQIGLHNAPLPTLKEGELLVRVEAAPINPSDLGVLTGAGNFTKSTKTKTADDLVALEAPIHDLAFSGSIADRAGKPGLICGNEGAGIVVGPQGHPLLGRTVGMVGGEMYAQYRAIPADKILPLPADFPPRQAASWFVNPLTALGMIEYMRLDGHKAIVHTAAASQLGQMLAKLCAEQNIPLVGIVRRDEHVELLKSLGVKHALNSKSETFTEDLVAAIADTRATIAFDATGGGTLAAQILSAMEAGAKVAGEPASWYGTDVKKDLHIYGGLDKSPLTFNPSWFTAGFMWSINGFLLHRVLARVGPARSKELFGIVGKNLTTHFKTNYTAEISLEEMLDPAILKEYLAQKTGEKYLVNPSKI